MREPSPGYVEFVQAIEGEIAVKGEIVSFEQFVKEHCSFGERYAYYLLESVAPIWGYRVERLPCKTGGHVLRITRQ